MDLPALWNLIRADLAVARATLPAEAASKRFVIDYQDYLDHNELELACDMLDAYADDHAVSPGFWKALASAAEKMGLAEKAARFRGTSAAR